MKDLDTYHDILVNLGEQEYLDSKIPRDIYAPFEADDPGFWEDGRPYGVMASNVEKRLTNFVINV